MGKQHFWKDQQSRNIRSLSPHSQIMSSQALKATVQQSVRMASQVVEQQSRHGGGFVWRAGVGYQYQGRQPQHSSEQQEGKEREGQFTQGLGWNISIRVMATAPSLHSSIT